MLSRQGRAFPARPTGHWAVPSSLLPALRLLARYTTSTAGERDVSYLRGESDITELQL